jgi:hypothetical protein
MNKIIRKLTYKVRSRWKEQLHSHKKKKMRKKILQYFSRFPTADEEITEAVSYLQEHPLTTFYGSFQEKYNHGEVEVFIDETNGLPYVITHGKKLYFKRSQNRYTVQRLFNNLRMEQDENAPHCYTDNDFQIEKEEILADVGCAEGYFSLLHIEKTKRIYLFEQDREWIEALEATFAPWKEKIEIIAQFVSDNNNSEEISLDCYFQQKEIPGFYKIDVEGAEASVLRGMHQLLQSQPLKMALCTYHHQEDYTRFSHFFEAQGFRYRRNRGVMIYQNDLDSMTPPFFRTCLIKATHPHD